MDKTARRKPRKPGALQIFIANAIDGLVALVSLVLWVLAYLAEGFWCWMQVLLAAHVFGFDISPLGLFIGAAWLQNHRRDQREQSDEEDDKEESDEEWQEARFDAS